MLQSIVYVVFTIMNRTYTI